MQKARTKWCHNFLNNRHPQCSTSQSRWLIYLNSFINYILRPTSPVDINPQHRKRTLFHTFLRPLLDVMWLARQQRQADSALLEYKQGKGAFILCPNVFHLGYSTVRNLGFCNSWLWVTLVNNSLLNLGPRCSFNLKIHPHLSNFSTPVTNIREALPNDMYIWSFNARGAPL